MSSSFANMMTARALGVSSRRRTILSNSPGLGSRGIFRDWAIQTPPERERDRERDLNASLIPMHYGCSTNAVKGRHLGSHILRLFGASVVQILLGRSQTAVFIQQKTHLLLSVNLLMNALRLIRRYDFLCERHYTFNYLRCCLLLIFTPSHWSFTTGIIKLSSESLKQRSEGFINSARHQILSNYYQHPSNDAAGVRRLHAAFTAHFGRLRKQLHQSDVYFILNKWRKRKEMDLE